MAQKENIETDYSKVVNYLLMQKYKNIPLDYNPCTILCSLPYEAM